MRPTQESIELVEAALERAELLRITQVPLTHEPRPITRFAQCVGNRPLAGRQANLRGGRSLVSPRVELMSKPLLITPGEQASAGRATDGARDVPTGEPHTRGGQIVEMRSGNFLSPLKAKVAIAEVIGDDHHNVRLVRWLLGPCVNGGIEPRHYEERERTPVQRGTTSEMQAGLHEEFTF
jgi:hypothetical protein